MKKQHLNFCAKEREHSNALLAKGSLPVEVFKRATAHFDEHTNGVDHFCRFFLLSIDDWFSTMPMRLTQIVPDGQHCHHLLLPLIPTG